jgi:hypothetical protein
VFFNQPEIDTVKHRHLTTGQAGRVVGFSQNTMIRCCQSGDLKHFVVPGSSHRRITRKSLEEWAKRHGLELDWTQLDHKESGCEH